MANWMTRTPWDPDDDFFRDPRITARDRARSLDGRALLRNFGPRPLETEEDRVARSQAEMARLVREVQQKAFMDRLMREVDAEERVTGEPPAQPVEEDMSSSQAFSEPPPTLNGTWRYRDVVATAGNGGMDS